MPLHLATLKILSSLLLELVLKETLDLKVLRAFKEFKVILELKVLRVFKEPKAFRARQELKVLRESKVSRE